MPLVNTKPPRPPKIKAKKAGVKSAAVKRKKDKVKFSYSVSYFNWAVSDSEEDDDDEVTIEEDEVVNVVLPLRGLKISKK